MDCLRDHARGRQAGPYAYVVMDDQLSQIQVPSMPTRDHKQLFFDFLASLGMILKPDAIGFGGEAWICDIAPDKLRGMSQPEQMRILGMGSAWLVEHGFSSRFESISISAQDRYSAYFVTLPFTRIEGKVTYGEEKRRLVPQANLDLSEFGMKFYRQKKPAGQTAGS